MSQVNLGKRICVIGTSGSGKTYVAEALAERLAIPYISNDAIIWRANWQPTPDAERLPAVEAATEKPYWTFDGNVSLWRPEDRLVLERCDTVVWLDLSRWQVWSQVVRRTVVRLITREELWQGNKESLRIALSRDSIIWWSIKTFARHRRAYISLFADPTFADKIRLRFRDRREVNAYLASLSVPTGRKN